MKVWGHSLACISSTIVHCFLLTHINEKLDVGGTYPNVGLGENQSKETTKLEVSAIEGLTDDVRRIVGINLVGGTSNAIEHCVRVHGLPLPTAWLADFEKDMCA